MFHVKHFVSFLRDFFYENKLIRQIFCFSYVKMSLFDFFLD